MDSKTKSRTLYLQKPVWQGSEYASELASKVKDVSFLNELFLYTLHLPSTEAYSESH